MVAAPTSDRQPLQRGCDVGRVLPYCQAPNRSNTSRDTFHYAGYAFVFPITRQTRAGSQRTNSRPPVSSLLRDRSSRRNSRWSRPFDCFEEHRPRRQRSSTGASDPIRASHTGPKLRWLVGRSKQSVRRTVSRGSNSASNGGTRRRRRVPPGGRYPRLANRRLPRPR